MANSLLNYVIVSEGGGQRLVQQSLKLALVYLSVGLPPREDQASRLKAFENNILTRDGLDMWSR